MADPIRATEKHWEGTSLGARQGSHLCFCILELRDRVAALEVVAARVAPAAERAPAGVTVEELTCVMREVPDTDYRGEAAWLLDHPRLGPLLRGEGAPAPKRVEQAQGPTHSQYFSSNHAFSGEVLKILADAARAMVERQQQGGQADAL